MSSKSAYRILMGLILLVANSSELICEETPETERAIVAHALAQAHNQEYLAAGLKRISEMDTEVVRCAVIAFETRLSDLKSERAIVAALRLFRRHTGRLPDSVRAWAEGMSESANPDIRNLALGLVEFQEHIKNEIAKKDGVDQRRSPQRRSIHLEEHERGVDGRDSEYEIHL